jgi:hypothetical protein
MTHRAHGGGAFASRTKKRRITAKQNDQLRGMIEAGLSDASVARQCDVSEDMVAKLRRALVRAA